MHKLPELPPFNYPVTLGFYSPTELRYTKMCIGKEEQLQAMVSTFCLAGMVVAFIAPCYSESYITTKNQLFIVNETFGCPRIISKCEGDKVLREGNGDPVVLKAEQAKMDEALRLQAAQRDKDLQAEEDKKEADRAKARRYNAERARRKKEAQQEIDCNFKSQRINFSCRLRHFPFELRRSTIAAFNEGYVTNNKTRDVYNWGNTRQEIIYHEYVGVSLPCFMFEETAIPYLLLDVIVLYGPDKIAADKPTGNMCNKQLWLNDAKENTGLLLKTPTGRPLKKIWATAEDVYKLGVFFGHRPSLPLNNIRYNWLITSRFESVFCVLAFLRSTLLPHIKFSHKPAAGGRDVITCDLTQMIEAKAIAEQQGGKRLAKKIKKDETRDHLLPTGTGYFSVIYYTYNDITQKGAEHVIDFFGNEQRDIGHVMRVAAKYERGYVLFTKFNDGSNGNTVHRVSMHHALGDDSLSADALNANVNPTRWGTRNDLPTRYDIDEMYIYNHPRKGCLVEEDMASAYSIIYEKDPNHVRTKYADKWVTQKYID